MRLFDIQSTAEFLGISRQTIDRLIQDHKLEGICIRAGKRKRVLRVTDAALKKFLGLKMSDQLIVEPAVVKKEKKEEEIDPLNFICTHCGNWSFVEVDYIENGTTLHCPQCDKDTIVDLFRPDERLRRYGSGS